jgi:hypothetical protein
MMDRSIERAERLIGEWPDTHISDEARSALTHLVDNLQAERARSGFLLAERDAAEAELEQCEWERRAAVAELAYLKGRLRAAEARVNPDALADALDDLASDATLGSFPVGNYDRGAGVLRAAAARLRQHHALLYAIGDPDEFTAEAESWLAYVPVYFMEKWDAAAWVDQVRRIAAAVQPPDPKEPT